MPSEYNPTNNVFSLERIRFKFEAAKPEKFPNGKAGNVFRGVLGWALQQTDNQAYIRFFEPRRARGDGPSGFATPPRPFVLRAGHLDGQRFESGESFYVDLHLFNRTPADAFISAMERLPVGTLRSIQRENIVVPLTNRHIGIKRMTVRFVTLTELKADGGLAQEVTFRILFSRARDRVHNFCEEGLGADFAGMATRAASVTLVEQNLAYAIKRRTSRKTGQTHPLGGFQGEATYEGDLDEFMPLLEAACWTGIGRQTVWGKGAIELQFR